MKKVLAAAAVLMFCLAMTAQFAMANPGASDGMSGKVLETMNSGTYTYIQLQTSKEKVWVAVPETKVKVGEKITVAPGMWMVNFKSKTLDKTFDKIYFSEGVVR